MERLGNNQAKRSVTAPTFPMNKASNTKNYSSGVSPIPKISIYLGYIQGKMGNLDGYHRMNSFYASKEVSSYTTNLDRLSRHDSSSAKDV